MKLVIFDCDGTLVDSQHHIVAAMEEAFGAERLLPPPREAVVSVVGLSLTTAVARLLPADGDMSQIVRIADAYKAAFAARRQRPDHDEPLFPGVGEAVRALSERDNVLLGIATGKSRRGVAAVLEREGFSRLFATIQTADTHPSKPDPSMIMAAMAETGAAPRDTLMIGDTTYDIEMALGAGVGAVGVGWGYHPAAALRDAGAHILVETGHELEPALDKLMQTRVTAA
jgi:phosphoglycolate phosphatase